MFNSRITSVCLSLTLHQKVATFCLTKMATVTSYIFHSTSLSPSLTLSPTKHNTATINTQLHQQMFLLFSVSGCYIEQGSEFSYSLLGGIFYWWDFIVVLLYSPCYWLGLVGEGIFVIVNCISHIWNAEVRWIHGRYIISLWVGQSTAWQQMIEYICKWKYNLILSIFTILQTFTCILWSCWNACV